MLGYSLDFNYDTREATQLKSNSTKEGFEVLFHLAVDSSSPVV